jgi:hypothetical protein
MKKIATALLGGLLTVSLFSPGSSLAETTASPLVIGGKAVEGRILVPIRYLSEGLGATVDWDQQEQTITVRQASDKLIIKINSTRARWNDQELRIDVPAQASQGVTYVPIRVISQALKGTLTWEASSRTAQVTLGDRSVTVTTETSYNWSTVSQSRVNSLIRKANEAIDLSSYSQVRAHFKPYFTDAYINKLIRQREMKIQHPFTTTAYSSSVDRTGRISQSASFADIGSPAVERTLELKYLGGQWMVDDIFFTYLYP